MSGLTPFLCRRHLLVYHDSPTISQCRAETRAVGLRAPVILQRLPGRWWISTAILPGIRPEFSILEIGESGAIPGPMRAPGGVRLPNRSALFQINHLCAKRQGVSLCLKALHAFLSMSYTQKHRGLVEGIFWRRPASSLAGVGSRKTKWPRQHISPGHLNRIRYLPAK